LKGSEGATREKGFPVPGNQSDSDAAMMCDRRGEEPWEHAGLLQHARMLSWCRERHHHRVGNCIALVVVLLARRSGIGLQRISGSLFTVSNRFDTTIVEAEGVPLWKVSI
jgi:hypothetical protein